ncbi:MAG: 4Fe-4S cluster-binding domain-containing protein [Muribaculaceae bacterium]|nr:4Fe-4S cluster-binding domain-containing protein [Muribaculaceae bacterium]
MEYNILSIIRGTTVDGPGFRTSIYLAGCSHACPGCHNPSSWNPEGGSVMTLEEIMEIVKEEDFDVTLSGGDPLFQASKVKTLIETLKEDNRNVWVFTGYLW